MDEQAYFTAWKSRFNEPHKIVEPTDLALWGGRLCATLEPAFIFCAGYQAAIRATFPELDSDGWLAYAASEDRSEQNPKPGVTVRANQLYGFKTWIAASRFVEDLVLKVGRGIDAQYVSVHSTNAGVTITHNPTPGFLPKLSQGIAEFKGANFSAINDLTRVPGFADSEPYFIYIALLSALSEHASAVADKSSGEIIAAEARKILQAHGDASAKLLELDSDVQKLLASSPFETSGLLSTWGSDARLFSMYSQGIRTRQTG